MRKMLGLSLLFLFLAVLNVSSIPVYADNIPSLKPGKALVVFYRPRRGVGAGIRFEIIDSAKGSIGQLVNGTIITRDLDPGTHTFTTRSLSVDGRDSITISAEAGSTHYIRGELMLGWPHYRPKFVRMSEAEAKAELTSMK